MESARSSTRRRTALPVHSREALGCHWPRPSGGPEGIGGLSEGEEEVEASRALLDLHRTHGIALSVLDLTAYEVGNALLRGVDVGAQKVSAVLDALAVICPRLALTPTELSDAVVLAGAHRLTTYDAAYAAAARARHFELATLDRALLGAGLGRRPSEILVTRVDVISAG